jgi:hypothetical protein
MYYDSRDAERVALSGLSYASTATTLMTEVWGGTSEKRLLGRTRHICKDNNSIQFNSFYFLIIVLVISSSLLANKH